MKNLSVVRLFNDDECDEIIESVEKNKEKLKVSSDNGWDYLSAYEMDVTTLELNIQKTIFNKIKTFSDLEIKGCFIIKYSEDLIPELLGHYDGCEYSISINLSNDYEGGETYLPILKHKHIPQDHPRGSGLVFESYTMNSWHKALPVKNGVRYTLVVHLIKKNESVFSELLKTLKLVVLTKVIEKFNLYSK